MKRSLLFIFAIGIGGALNCQIRVAGLGNYGLDAVGADSAPKHDGQQATPDAFSAAPDKPSGIAPETTNATLDNDVATAADETSDDPHGIREGGGKLDSDGLDALDHRAEAGTADKADDGENTGDAPAGGGKLDAANASGMGGATGIGGSGGTTSTDGSTSNGGTTSSGGSTSNGGSTNTDGTTRRLVFSDEFDGPAQSGADTSRWVYANSDPGTINNDKQKYTSHIDNVFQDGQGHLVLRALRSLNSKSTYTSGRLETNGTIDFKYGRFEIRAILPAGQGSFPGIVLLGTMGNWPECGEISILEQWGQDKSWFKAGALTGGASGNMGYVTYNFADATSASSTFHVYAVDWYPDHLSFQVDGTEFARTTYDTTSPFYTIPEYLVLSLALGGDQGGPIDDTAFPMDLILDYVRVYAF